MNQMAVLHPLASRLSWPMGSTDQNAVLAIPFRRLAPLMSHPGTHFCPTQLSLVRLYPGDQINNITPHSCSRLNRISDESHTVKDGIV